MAGDAFDISDLVKLDPDLERRGAQITAYRLTQKGPDHDGEYRYAFTARVERRKRWPKGQYLLYLYDSEGLLAGEAYLPEAKALESGIRHLEGAAYAKNIESAAVIFQPYDADDDATHAELDHGWQDVPLEQLNPDYGEAPPFAVQGALCQYRRDFEAANLLIVQLDAAVALVTASRFPKELTALITVHDDQDRLLLSGNVDVVGTAAKASRPLHFSGRVYKHTPPAVVRVVLSTPEDDLALADASMSPAHSAVILRMLKEINEKLDRLLENRSSDLP